jgi:hypothetical protein
MLISSAQKGEESAPEILVLTKAAASPALCVPAGGPALNTR